MKVIHLALNPMFYVVLCNSAEGTGSFDFTKVTCRKCLLMMERK